MNIIKLIPLFTLTLFLFGCGPRIVTDCGGPTFIKLYGGSNNDLKQDFNLLIKENTKFLKNCQVVSYSEIYEGEIKGLLEQYSLNLLSYNVSFSCYNEEYGEIMNFYASIYKKGDKFYRLSLGFVPCDRKEIFFESTSPEANYGWSLETKAIEDYRNLKNAEYMEKQRVSG